jgi:hypothetical protein
VADGPDRPGSAPGAAGHAGHDLERIAALVDTDLSPADRMTGEAMVASCTECAQLRDALFALAGAASAMPAPPRTRDFRLTSADAARLAPVGWGEPATATTRLTGDMFDPRITAGHPAHDTVLVASLVDHSLPASERDAAQHMVDTCRRCAELHTDLLALRQATRTLPTPPRPRDYRLSAADAERLRPAGIRRWIVAFGSPRDAITRPLAIGLTTLGIVGLLVSGAPLLSFGSASSSASGGPAAAAPQPAASQPAMDVTIPAPAAGAAAAEASGGPAAAAASAAASAAPLAPGVYLPAPTTAPGNGSAEFLGDQGGRSTDTAGVKAAAPTAPVPGISNQDQAVGVQGSQPAEPGPVVSPIVVSGILLLVGLGLFLLRWMARRVGA